MAAVTITGASLAVNSASTRTASWSPEISVEVLPGPGGALGSWRRVDTGGIRTRLRMRPIDAETRWPSLSSSPWTRLWPHDRFSRASRSIRAASSSDRGGLPLRFGYVQFRATRRRWHRNTVPGVTSRWLRSGLGSRRISAARTARSAQSSRGRGLVRRSTATSWRSTSNSASLDTRAGQQYREPSRRDEDQVQQPQRHDRRSSRSTLGALAPFPQILGFHPILEPDRVPHRNCVEAHPTGCGCASTTYACELSAGQAELVEVDGDGPVGVHHEHGGLVRRDRRSV